MGKIEDVNLFDPVAFGERLKAARMAVRPRLSQAAVAARLGVEQPSISRWEKGTVVPDVGHVARMCGLYGVTVGEVLLGESETPGAVLLKLADRADAMAVALRSLARGAGAEKSARASHSRQLARDAREAAHGSPRPSTAEG